MNFLEKLDFLMSEMSINKSKLSQISGVPYTTIDGFYKKGYINRPAREAISADVRNLLSIRSPP